MKKKVMREVHSCDNCGKIQEWAMDKCLSCGVEHCHDCMEKMGVEYPHAVGFQGSDDGYFCNACDANPKASVELLAAYRAIAALSKEQKAFNADFDKRRKAAEERLKGLRR